MIGHRFCNFFRNSAGIQLSSATVPDNAGIGTVVGLLSVSGGAGAYTFTLTSNPGGLFSIVGNQLRVAAALTAGSDPITVHADNGAGSIFDRPFIITVTSSFIPSLDFSDARDSQYLL